MFLSSSCQLHSTTREERGTCLSGHSNLETITEINMNNLPTNAIHQQIRRVPITQSQNMSHHRHDRQCPTIITPPIEPSFRISRFEPKDTIEVLSGRVVECVFEYFELLHEAEMIEIGRHLEDESMFDVEEDLSTVSVVLDEDVQRVGTVDPTEETRVRRERNDGIFDNGEVSLERLGILLQERVDETEELHDSLVLSEILVTCIDCQIRNRQKKKRR